MGSTKQNRVITTIAYLALLAAVHGFVISPSFAPSLETVWFYSGAVSLVLGSRLLTPHFTPPADAATNAIFATIAMLTIMASDSLGADARIAASVMLGASILVLLSGLIVLLIKQPGGLESRAWLLAWERGVRGSGSPNVVFTTVILVSVFAIHRGNPTEVIAILASWTVIVALRPLDSVMDLLRWFRDQRELGPRELLGTVAAYQSPGIVLIRQTSDIQLPRGTLMLIGDRQGPTRLGVAVNYVGRDEGHLLRTLSLPLPAALKGDAGRTEAVDGAARLLEVDEETRQKAGSVLERIDRLCGVVDNGTTLDRLEFEVIDEGDLSEGRLVEVKVGRENVIYQVIDGVTHEELVQQKNKYGYARARARKVGKWNAEKSKFEAAPWLPNINAPVFLKDTAAFDVSAEAVGHFPSTDYSVSIDIHEAITHNTAILGILGVGKSFLAIELVERMIAEGIKIICLDLTDQYQNELKPFVVEKHQTAVMEGLQPEKGRGKTAKTKQDGGTIRDFSERVKTVLKTFLSAESPYPICIINPASLTVWQQIGAQDFRTGEADMAQLTPTEITAIISHHALHICQDLGMTDKARACLVYEEAHSLIPEWNSVAAEGDKKAASASSRAILQGRKFGLGCLLITQRTANVTKTILNQCNTVFAMRTFDTTSENFLSNYIGADYASILPNLQPRHAVFFGKASSCDDPVLIRLNDREEFETAFRATHLPCKLPEFTPDDALKPGAVEEGEEDDAPNAPNAPNAPVKPRITRLDEE